MCVCVLEYVWKYILLHKAQCSYLHIQNTTVVSVSAKQALGLMVSLALDSLTEKVIFRKYLYKFYKKTSFMSFSEARVKRPGRS